MNPSAQAFVPKKKAPDANATKLSAAAIPFVPPKNKPQSEQQHADPEKQPTSPLSAKASPYTPTDPKVASKFPAAPAAVDGDEAMDAKAAGNAKEGLTPLAQPLSATEMMEKQIEELPPAAPVDWSDSKLPALFGCHNTKAKATSEPIRLNTQWVLYADDHGAVSTPLSTAVGSPMAASGNASFDPVEVSTVGDVESFWRLWRHLPPPSACPVPFTYSWFRHDIKPEWEHPRNKRGGIITIVVYDRDKIGLNDPKVLDDVWMATLTGCAGESWTETATMLNGVMLKLRANNRPVTMQLWFSSSESTKLRAFANSFRDSIGKIMGTKWLQKLEFYSHNQRQSTNNTLAARMKVKPKLSPDFTF